MVIAMKLSKFVPGISCWFFIGVEMVNNFSLFSFFNEIMYIFLRIRQFAMFGSLSICLCLTMKMIRFYAYCNAVHVCFLQTNIVIYEYLCEFCMLLQWIIGYTFLCGNRVSLLVYMLLGFRSFASAKVEIR